MSRAPGTVQAEMLGLSPIGYSRDPASVWGKQLLAPATEGSLIEQMGEVLHHEIDPRASIYLLPEWQAEFGADPYGVDTSNMITPQLQSYLYQRLINRGGQSRGFYSDLAASLGVPIGITEFTVTRYDQAVYDDGVYVEPPAQFQWLVTLPATQTTVGVYDDLRYDEASETIAQSPIQSILSALAPAHTQVIFSYTG